MKLPRPRVVIIGGGFGGLAAARALAKSPVEITLLDRTNHHVFQPLLYQVATAGLSPADISAPIRQILNRQSNVQVLMAEVTEIDVNRKVAVTESAEHAYDFLIVATGVRHGYFGHPDWETHAPGIKTISDATHVRKRILEAFELAEAEPDPEKRAAYLTLVLVGGGPTGVEMAGAIAELAQRALKCDFRRIHPEQARIILIEAGDRLLGTFEEGLANQARRALERMKVEVRTGVRVTGVDAQGVLIGEERIASRCVIWTAGVAAHPVGLWLGAEADSQGRVRVTPNLSVPGLPDIFVVGDAATMAPDCPPVPGVCQGAMQGGRFAGELIAARVESRPEPTRFAYRDKGNMATVGRKFAVGDLGWAKVSGAVAWFLWLALHISYLIGFRNRLVVLLNWAWAYVTFQRGARLIT